MFKQLVSKLFFTKAGNETAVSDVDNLPVVDSELLEQFNSQFSRILEKRFLDTEEVRYDIPAGTGLVNGSIYLGIAADGTATSDATWTVVRFYFNGNKLPSRARIKKNISWDNRTVGW